MRIISTLLLVSLLFVSAAYGAPATMYVTVAGAGTKAGGSWANAMDAAAWVTDMQNGAEAGDVYYVAGGTYNTSINSLRDGSATAQVKVIGVKSTTTNEPPTASDWAYGDDRPLMTAAASAFIVDDFWEIHNFRVTSTATNAMYADYYPVINNCYVYNSSESATRVAYRVATTGSTIVGSEGISTNGDAVYIGTMGRCIQSYFHDSVVGVRVAAYYQMFIGNIFDTCTTAIMTDAGGATSYHYEIMEFNVFYNSTLAIDGSSCSDIKVFNNIFHTNTTGVSFTASNTGAIFIDWNIWYNNGTDVSNCSKGSNDITGDPGFTDAAGGDFTIGTGSNALKAAAQIRGAAGASTFKWNIGADQDDNVAAGGGARGARFIIQ